MTFNMKGKLSETGTSEKLINLVREHQEVYNQRLKEYKDTDLTSNIWRSIANELSVDGVKGKLVSNKNEVFINAYLLVPLKRDFNMLILYEIDIK